MKGKAYLLKFIEANGGSVDRGAFAKVVQELTDQGYLKAVFPVPIPQLPKDHYTYTFDLTKKGREALAAKEQTKVVPASELDKAKDLLRRIENETMDPNINLFILESGLLE